MILNVSFTQLKLLSHDNVRHWPTWHDTNIPANGAIVLLLLRYVCGQYVCACVRVYVCVRACVRACIDVCMRAYLRCLYSAILNRVYIWT